MIHQRWFHPYSNFEKNKFNSAIFSQERRVSYNEASVITTIFNFSTQPVKYYPRYLHNIKCSFSNRLLCVVALKTFIRWTLIIIIKKRIRRLSSGSQSFGLLSGSRGFTSVTCSGFFLILNVNSLLLTSSCKHCNFIFLGCFLLFLVVFNQWE